MRETNLEGFALDKYQVQQFIGEGGFAEVYRALATDLHVDVAVKVLKPSQAAIPGNVERFADEARQTAQLRHPNIVTIYAFGTCNGWHYIAMQLLEGETLAERIERQRGPLAPAEVAHIVRNMAQALDHAHGRGRIHRDVKPQNIFLQHDGSVVLTDFGLVKQLKGTNITVTQTIIGTPEYMSPEQVRGVGIGPKSDIYALGHVAFEALTGRAAFPASTGNPFPVLMAHVEQDLPWFSLAGAGPDAVRSVNDVLRTATAKAPEARFASAGAFASALENAVGAGSKPGTAAASGGRKDAQSSGMPAWTSWAVGIVAVTAGLGGILYVAGMDGGSKQATNAQRTATAEALLAPVFGTSTAEGQKRREARETEDARLAEQHGTATALAVALRPTITPPPEPTPIPAPTRVAAQPVAPVNTPVPPPTAIVVAIGPPQTTGSWPSAEVRVNCRREDAEGQCAHHSQLTLSWSGTLGPDDTFHVVAHRTGVAAADLDTFTAAHCDASIDVSMFCATIPATVPNSNYEWHVRVVRASDRSARSDFSDTRTQFIDVRFTPKGD